jgi:uncharacterized membrane protein
MRWELLHPMIVGFPISFLIFGSFLRISCFFFKKREFYPQLVTYSRVLVLIGILLGITAVFSGEIANNIIYSSLCNPDTLDSHQAFGYTTLVVYTLAYLLDRASKLSKIFEIIALLLFCFGFILLFITGYFGGSLVFDQGAAVEKLCNSLAK